MRVPLVLPVAWRVRRPVPARSRRVLRWAWRAPRADYRLVRWVFLRGLGAVFFIAFTSLGRQVLGLHGSRGIVPARDVLAAEGRGPRAFVRLPSLFWLTASDEALRGGCRVGQVLAAALVLDVAPLPALVALWALYLSYVSVGRPFLSFQWDALLLETAALGALMAPAGVRPGAGARGPSWLQVALMRWLVLRLYLESGLAKLQSGDRTWRELGACTVYFETEPLPNRGGWWAHHLPRPVLQAATAATLALETAVPLLALGPRAARRWAFGLLTGLQALIAATGNYGFFNLLSVLLHVWLLDDAQVRRVLALPRPRRPRRGGRWPGRVRDAAGAALLVASAHELAGRCPWPALSRALPARLDAWSTWAQRLWLVSAYGLFAVMTVRRPEITIEGTRDGVHWHEYRFRYKVGVPSRAPRQVAPHMPRLDWQMWFAALGSPPRWFLALLDRLLEGAPEVLALFEEDPFAGRPPRQVRALLHLYRMSTREQRRREGTWWQREPLGLWVGPRSRQDDDGPAWTLRPARL